MKVKKKRDIESEDVRKIEVVYTTHFTFDVDDLEVDWSQVDDGCWEVEHGFLRYELKDGTVGEERLSEFDEICNMDNIDTESPYRYYVHTWTNKEPIKVAK